jgi:hypothetical protein
LQLLDEVFKQIPASLLNSIVLPKIVRDKVDFDAQGNQAPNTFGSYAASTGVLKIFDQAFSPYDFQNDADGSKQFKGTLIHELTHVITRSKGSQAYYIDTYFNPLLGNYMSVGSASGATWQMSVNGSKWIYNASATSQLPTTYAGTDPEEDLCESTMLYIMDPARLTQSSVDRYNYIRDNIFGGIEYENGVQKKP